MEDKNSGSSYNESSPESEFNRLKNKVGSMVPSAMFIGEQMERLLVNGSIENHGKNHIPVVYFSINKIGYSFLLTEINPEKPDIAYGLCDYDTKLKIESVSLSSLYELAEKKGTTLRAHPEVRLNFPLAVYAQVASVVGTIIVDNTPEKFNKLFREFGGGKNVDMTQPLALNENLTKVKGLIPVHQ